MKLILIFKTADILQQLQKEVEIDHQEKIFENSEIDIFESNKKPTFSYFKSFRRFYLLKLFIKKANIQENLGDQFVQEALNKVRSRIS